MVREPGFWSVAPVGKFLSGIRVCALSTTKVRPHGVRHVSFGETSYSFLFLFTVSSFAEPIWGSPLFVGGRAHPESRSRPVSMRRALFWPLFRLLLWPIYPLWRAQLNHI